MPEMKKIDSGVDCSNDHVIIPELKRIESFQSTPFLEENWLAS